MIGEKPPPPYQALDGMRLSRFPFVCCSYGPSLPLLVPDSLQGPSGSPGFCALPPVLQTCALFGLHWEKRSSRSGRVPPACCPRNLSNEALVGIPGDLRVAKRYRGLMLSELSTAETADVDIVEVG
ncbi:unnamed protein product [Rangifer tarandus platyrhynchus]|uniref:Uncharacterized protein n=1 Tax=Rangifer tarandus platyrhynchus TaxID=3082113 RepID=A0ABN8ZDJ5_RANTA|nr:unnamed protein product [Rangifer tarandus platyrhynchus]CAI9688659.1 unnamed protein product [Rangifer tarandus platyrhynchus]